MYTHIFKFIRIMSILSRFGYSSWNRINTFNLFSKRTQTTVSSSPFSIFDIAEAGKRRLSAVCYSYLLSVNTAKIEHALINQFNTALGLNMTETISALTLLADVNCAQLGELLEKFYLHWKNDPDAMNYCLRIRLRYNDA